MKEKKLWLALNLVDDRHLEVKDTMSKEAIHMNPKHNRSNKKLGRILLIAAVVTCLLGTAAFAAYSIHQQRQQKLRQELNIDQNYVQSYEEYAALAEMQSGVTLLSAIRDVDFQRVYINVSPIEREEIEAFPQNWDYYFSVDGGQSLSSATPYFDPAKYDGSGPDGIRRAIFETGYDEETKTLTMECPVLLEKPENILDAEGRVELRLVRIDLETIEDITEGHELGRVSVPITQLETRVIRFEPITVTEPESGIEVTIRALELNPTSATWHLSYEGIPNTLAEDYIGNNAVLRFADGTEMKTGGPVASGYSDGVAYPKSLWVKAIDIHALAGVNINGRELTIIG